MMQINHNKNQINALFKLNNAQRYNLSMYYSMSNFWIRATVFSIFTLSNK